MKVLLAIAALGLAAAGQAKPPASPLPAEVQLRPGIEQAEAERLVAKLIAAQEAVADGTAYFTLMAGAPAAYEANATAPRDSFLALDWGDLRFVEPMDTGSSYRKGYRMSVMPNGLGKLYWDVRVTLGAEGEIDHIEMFYGPPAPF